MKMYNILSIITTIMIVILSIQLASADITIWRDAVIDKNNSIVKAYGYVFFDDNSKSLLGVRNPIPVAVNYNWQDIPYNISIYYPEYSNAIVDYCNLTIRQDKYTFDDENNIISYDEILYTDFISSQSAGNNITFFLLKHKEALRISFDCHYTNPETLFLEGVLFGDFGVWYPAFTCSGCEEYKLEDLVKETEYNLLSVNEEISIYQKVQSIINLNMELWFIFSWVFKIAMLLLGVGLIFLAGYFFYVLIMTMAGRKTR